MTTDTQLAPTDAEIAALYAEQTGFILDDSPAALLDFARAVLAKWGTPPAVVGEPIGHLYCGGSYGDELEDWEIVADQHQCDKLNEHHGSLGKEARLPIYTTPQPTQAQAGPISGVKSFQTYAEANAYSRGYYAGKKAAKQPQVGAVPLTDEEVLDAFCRTPGIHQFVQAFWAGVRFAEQHHGIKGGQHGTE